MDIYNISKEKRECTVRLSTDELVMICNSFYYAENKYENSCLFHKLYSEMIIANNLCQYGHIDNFALSGIVKQLNKTENKISEILSENDKAVFESYIEMNDMPIAFGNSDWCRIYRKIVGQHDDSEKIREWINN